MISLDVKGGVEALNGINAALAANSPGGVVRNFRTLMTYLHGEVKRLTPGKGTLREAWRKSLDTNRIPGGWSLTGTIDNTMAGDRVYYTSISGDRKPKLKADDTPLLWSDVIHMLDVGTRPHEIRPRRAKALAFNVDQPRRNPKTGRFQKTLLAVFTQLVRHPGTVAYGMLSKTEQGLLNIIEAATNDIADGVVDAWGSDRSFGPGRGGVINPNL